MKKDIGTNEFKQIAYGVLEYTKYICEKYGIFYILSYGTVLGAVRHDGFIPWDDDIDICIFRKDYQRLISAFMKENDNRYRLISTEVDSHYSLPHMKIVDNNTILFQGNRINDYPLGIWIDVFALDNVPDNVNERKKYFRKLERYQSIWTLLEFMPYKEKKGIRSFAISMLRNVLAFAFDNNSRIWAIKLEKLARKYEHIDTREVGVLSFLPYDRNKSVFSREMLSDSILHKFENGEFPIPKDYDRYLKKIYGDYMKLPPLEKRITHHSYSVSFREDLSD